MVVLVHQKYVGNGGVSMVLGEDRTFCCLVLSMVSSGDSR